jgi:hypothetical protein
MFHDKMYPIYNFSKAGCCNTPQHPAIQLQVFLNMRHIYFALSEMFTYDDQSKIVAARNRQDPGLWLL